MYLLWHVHSACSYWHSTFPPLCALNSSILVIVVSTAIGLLLPLALWIVFACLVGVARFGQQVKARQGRELLFWPLEDIVQLGVHKVGNRHPGPLHGNKSHSEWA